MAPQDARKFKVLEYDSAPSHKRITRNSLIFALCLAVVTIGFFGILSGRDFTGSFTPEISLNTDLQDGYAAGILSVNYETDSKQPITRAQVSVDAYTYELTRDTPHSFNKTLLIADYFLHSYCAVVGQNNISYLSEQDGLTLRVQRTSTNKTYSTGYWYLNPSEIGTNLTVYLSFTPSSSGSYQFEFYNYTLHGWSVIINDTANSQISIFANFSDISVFRTTLSTSRTDQTYTPQFRLLFAPDIAPGFYLDYDRFILETPLDINLYNASFTIPLNTRDFSDGLKTVTLAIFDASGNTASITRTIYFDNTFPIIESFSLIPESGAIRITGRVTDNHKLRKVSVEYSNATTGFISQDMISLENASFDFEYLHAFLNGSYEVRLTAEDCAGNLVSSYLPLNYSSETNSTIILEPHLPPISIERAETALRGNPYLIHFMLPSPQLSAALFYQSEYLTEIRANTTYSLIFNEIGIQELKLNLYYQGELLNTQTLLVTVKEAEIAPDFAQIFFISLIVGGGVGGIITVILRRRIPRGD